MLTKEHRLYKAFRAMKEKENGIQKKKDEIFWKGLDSPYFKMEVNLHRDFFNFMKKVLKEEENLDFNFSDLEELYKNDKL